MALPLINQPALGGIKDLVVARGPKERSRYVGHVAQGPSILPRTRKPRTRRRAGRSRYLASKHGVLNRTRSPSGHSRASLDLPVPHKLFARVSKDRTSFGIL
ncbi:hypothetical protein ALC62_09481 [Cyphomyrmex costatus]|uniref:Uncharacterized protein n=1 Tax=Cyphomyrmex costatus TaxID=456900 RepID=A0A195CHF1_9HYME|nr:hypothetical protein ALC62_09481 [Cyphomyrmex costatus]